MTTTTNANENTTATAAADAAVPATVNAPAKAEEKKVAFSDKAAAAVKATGDAFVEGIIAGHAKGKFWSLKVVDKVDKLIDFEVIEGSEKLAERIKYWTKRGMRWTLYAILVPPAYLSGFVWGFALGFTAVMKDAYKGEVKALPLLKDKLKMAKAVEEDTSGDVSKVAASE